MTHFASDRYQWTFRFSTVRGGARRVVGRVTIQDAGGFPLPKTPPVEQLARAVRAVVAAAVPVLPPLKKPVWSLTYRWVGTDEAQRFNREFRQRDYAPNVLSFIGEDDYLGDVVVCVPVVAQEARAQHKTLVAHMQHIALHGLLHVLGYDHIQPKDALMMEHLERTILATLNVADPYADEEPHS
jgi:probable rRNA maturation factor